MPKLTISLSGEKELSKRIQALADASEEGVAQALYEMARDIFAESQRLVPVDTGTLKGSGGIEGPYRNRNGFTEVVVYYGGPAAPYALYVHEDLNASHYEPTTAKFLEGPFIAVTQDIEIRAAVEVAKAMSRS